MSRYALFFIVLSTFSFAQTRRDDLSFIARVKDVDTSKKTMLLNSKNPNIKFFKRNDEVFFYNELNPSFKCRGIVQKGTFTQLFLKIGEYSNCSKNVGMVIGSYLKLQSKDLGINLTMAEEVVDILLKKRMILKSKIYRLKNQINTKNERKELIDNEYQSKINSLKLEWKDAVKDLAFADSDAAKEINDSKLKMQDIDAKLRLYNVQDQRVKNSEWSLSYDAEDI